MKLLFDVRVRVPATSANLGPGFDVMGLALSLYNEVRLTGRSTGRRLGIVNKGEGARALPTDEKHLVYRAVANAFQKGGRRMPPSLELTLVNRIPLARGLGSSSAAIVGGIVAANAAMKGALSTQEMAQLAVDMEGHPDNVVPALTGGLAVSAVLKGRVEFLPWKEKSWFRGLKAVSVVPEFELSTAKARAVLPRTVSREDAVFNISRATLLLSALVRGRHDILGPAMEDRLHQPARAKLVPGLMDVLEEARRAGAWGSCLSGSGPTVLALSPAAKAAAVGRAMAKIFSAKKISARVFVLDADFEGAKVIR